VLLEAWASGTPVISSRTSGASSLVKQGETGWLFDLETPSVFHEALAVTLQNPELRMQLARAGAELVRAEYDVVSVASRVKKLYEQLIEEKHALCHSA
jgi:glycosyltransferase involved in cell wall biosynthesis